jgi:hypothetical protein
LNLRNRRASRRQFELFTVNFQEPCESGVLKFFELDRVSESGLAAKKILGLR